MNLKKIIIAGVLVALIVNAGKSNEPTDSIKNNYSYTGNLKTDLFGQNMVPGNKINFSENQSITNLTRGKKNPFVAAGLSFIIPGAGEIYSESYIKGGVFLAVEIAAWIFSLSYENKGDEQNNMFENFADERYSITPAWDTNEPNRYRTKWDVIRYYDWSNMNKSIINPQGNYSNLQNPIISNEQSLPPWERVDWNKLNAFERAIGRWYSHTLPKHGEQQYYELIGKYQQYNQGWWDANNNNYTYGDPLSETFKEYSKMRGLANDDYYKAKTAMTVVVVNHVISGIDAYFTAKNYNSNLNVEAKLNYDTTPFGDIPAICATLKYRF